jgi:SAM-dependent methyltransferase
MLERARERGCYRELRQMMLDEPLDFPDDEFDACVSVGVFTEGHAPASAFDEIARVVRPGGQFLFTIREDVFFEGGFRDRQEELERASVWRLLKQSQRFQPFPQTEPDIFSYVFVYEIA